MTFRVYNSVAELPATGWLQRSEKAKARIEAARAPLAMAVSRVRAAQRGVDEAANLAADRFQALHALVPHGLPEAIHPHVYALLRNAITAAGVTNLRRPIDIGPSLTELIEAATVESRAHLAACEAELAAIEASEGRRNAFLAQTDAQIDAALMSMDEPVDDAPVAAENDAPVRHRGRPRL